MSEKSPSTKMSENEYQNLRKFLWCLHTKISYKASEFSKSEIFVGISVSDLTRQSNFIFCNILGYLLSSLCQNFFWDFGTPEFNVLRFWYIRYFLIFWYFGTLLESWKIFLRFWYVTGNKSMIKFNGFVIAEAKKISLKKIR